MKRLAAAGLIIFGLLLSVTACGGGGGATPPAQPTRAIVEVFLTSTAMAKINATGNADLVNYGIAVDNTTGTSGAIPVFTVPAPFQASETQVFARNANSYFVAWQVPTNANGRTVAVNQTLFTLTYSITSGIPTFSIPANVQGSQILNVQAATFLDNFSGNNRPVVGLDSADMGIRITYQ